MEELFDRVFHLKENHTDARTEIIAGITTFMTMAYILIVNPSILSATGMDKGALVTTTALASALGTLFMAVFANYPFALAPGMGLNAYFAYTVVLQMGYTWQVALAAVFVEGLVFILLSLTNIREAIFNAIPLTLKRAISVGIGLSSLSLVCLTPRLSWPIRQPRFRSIPLRKRLLTGRSTAWASLSSSPSSGFFLQAFSSSRTSAATFFLASWALGSSG